MNETLVKKLRLSPDMKALVLKAPSDNYLEELGLTAESTIVEDGVQYDFVLLFVLSLSELEEYGPGAVRAVKPDGMLWITYPKGTSKIKTDINRDTGWKLMLKLDMEGVAMISMDDTWSSMRYRPEGTAKSSSRPKRTASAIVAAAASGRSSAPASEEAPLPEDLAAALQASPAAEHFFRGSLTAAKRRDFVNWITDAKRAETRTNRISATVDKLEKGLKSPFDK
ncbi:MAG: YdeI/OmpD-associated family protein [Bacillota bacterium]